jgi:hypothetical protein
MKARIIPVISIPLAPGEGEEEALRVDIYDGEEVRGIHLYNQAVMYMHKGSYAYSFAKCTRRKFLSVYLVCMLGPRAAPVPGPPS